MPVQHVESAWEPTPDELALLNAGGTVVLRIIGWQPPVAALRRATAGRSGGSMSDLFAPRLPVTEVLFR